MRVINQDGISYDMEQLANDLLATYENSIFLSIDPASWFNQIQETATFYNLHYSQAKEIHQVAMYIYIYEPLTERSI